MLTTWRIYSRIPQQVTPWTSAVPGAATNWTSEAETRRRRAPDTFKTGKKNARQVGQYVKYVQQQVLWTCVAPMDSQDPDAYVEGEQFPACEHWDDSWSEEEAEAKGWAKPFATDYANRIEGTDASMFGRPVTTDRLQVFISDIYRSAYLLYKGDETWNGVSLRRYGLQKKDLENWVDNPENEQYYAFGPSGMENTTAAVGVPVFVSFPHFLYGDPKLVAAIRGLDPREEIHDVFLDVEPQTGILARVGKRLQVNYQMKSQHLPATEPDSLDVAHDICARIDGVLNVLHTFGVNTGNITTLSCNNTLLSDMFTCWNQPSEWRLQGDDGSGNGEIFFPFGWVDEGMSLSNDDATEINDSLISLDDVAEQVRFWCLIVAGCCCAVLVLLQYHSCMDREYRLKKYGMPTPLLDFFFAHESDQDEDEDMERMKHLLCEDHEHGSHGSHGSHCERHQFHLAESGGHRGGHSQELDLDVASPMMEDIYRPPTDVEGARISGDANASVDATHSTSGVTPSGSRPATVIF